MKRYCSYVSQQPANWNKLVYQVAGDCPDSFAYPETRLPVLPLINATARGEKKIQVLLIATGSAPNDKRDENGETAYERNLRWTLDELKEWSKTNHTNIDYKIIVYPKRNNIGNTFELFRKTIAAMEENLSEEDIWYADMTYGMRTMTQSMLYALQYIYLIRKIPVEFLVYGEYDKDLASGIMHDVTAFLAMGSIISHVGGIKYLKEPEKLVHMALKEIESGEGQHE